MNNSNDSMKPKKLLINRQGLKVIRLTLSKDESIPEHSTNADVVVIVTKGNGVFYINDSAQDITQGDVIDLTPNLPHAIVAKSDLELIVTHMQLKKNDSQETGCGTESCSHN